MSAQLILAAPLPMHLSNEVLKTFADKELSPCGRAVLRILANPAAPCVGREKAMRIADMQEQWRAAGSIVYSDRSVKHAVKELLEEFGVGIGSNRGQAHPGYFICCSPSDAELAVQPLKNEIYSLFRRVRALSPKSEFVRKLNGQMAFCEDQDAANQIGQETSRA